MKKSALVLFFAALLLAALSSLSPAAFQTGPAGSLLIIGGGDRPDGLTKKFVELSRGFGSGKIVIFTMASGVPLEVGPEMVAEVKAAGAAEAFSYQLTREEALKPDSANILDGAGGVYFCGGDQSRLTAVLLDTPIHKKLLELYAQGLVVAGTSAGAAVMSEVMITGDEKRTTDENANWQTVEAGNVVTSRGFGFVTGAVMDQHFIARRRHNRLISLVLENPKLVGIGINESTAVWVRPDGRYEIAGIGQVIVYDARNASVSRANAGLLGVVGMTVHILLPGDVYDPATGKVEGARR
ncbi:MAG: cyanophycinase [Candidatus Aminicenantes bacterium]|nr:cyanophycinase [Candidatus Aminicenantes bacterium]